MKDFQKRIGYTFNNEGTLRKALTHSSYAAAEKGNYERLEFMGDSVLSFVISEYLIERCKSQEGELSKVRASVVCEQSLAQAAEKLNFAEVMLLGKGEEQTGGKTRPSILADMFEAVIAAIYFDGGIEPAKRFILDNLSDTVKLAFKGKVNKDYKTALQEIVQADGRTAEYVLVAESGPEHSKTFTCQVLIDGRIMGEGAGRSKKEAEQMAAKQAISRS